MTMWLPDLTDRNGPLFKQLSDAIAESVKTGRLPKGSRLPTQRELTDKLCLSLNTVSRAYADATERGFLRGEVGRGTYVREVGPLANEPLASGLVRKGDGPIDFSLNLPAPGRASDALSKSLADLSRTNDLPALLDYQTRGGITHHTSAATQWLHRVGLDAKSESIVLTTGAQHGIMATLLATMRPGDVLLTEELTYAPIKAMALHLGLKIAPIASDMGTLCPDEIDATCSATTAKVLYCTPTLHTPTTATIDEDLRFKIAGVARKHDLIVIEDDVFGFLPEDRPAPLATFAPERTIYITSVSKSLAPGLRVGYLHAPPELLRKIQTAVQLSCWMPAPLMVEIASRWIADGTADLLNAYQREEASARQAMANSILPSDSYRAHPNGFHIWLNLPPGLHADRFRMEAEAQGVKVLPGNAFAINPTDSVNAIRLCLSHEATRDRVREGLKIILGIFQSENSAGYVFL